MTAESNSTRSTGNLVAAIVLSCFFGVALLATLIAWAGPWDIVSMTRLLHPLIDGGFIQYHDLDAGFIKGVPDQEYYLMALDPVSWGLVIFAGLVFLLHATVKGVQFGRIARAYGIEGDPGTHMRAYLYGYGLDQILPYKLGAVATATSLSNQGASASRAASAVFVSDAFTVFEIVVFGLLGLYWLGWSAWLGTILWALLLFGLLYALTRGTGATSSVSLGDRSLQTGIQVARSWAAKRPAELVGLCLLSLISFGLFDVATYIIMSAFHSVNVLISMDRDVLLMAIVGGYIARLIPVTPGGIGQFEWGFAVTLFVGARDISVPLVVIALLVTGMRVLTGMMIAAFVAGAYGVKTNMREVIAVFSEAQEPARS